MPGEELQVWCVCMSCVCVCVCVCVYKYKYNNITVGHTGFDCEILLITNCKHIFLNFATIEMQI